MEKLWERVGDAIAMDLAEHEERLSSLDLHREIQNYGLSQEEAGDAESWVRAYLESQLPQCLR